MNNNQLVKTSVHSKCILRLSLNNASHHNVLSEEMMADIQSVLDKTVNDKLCEVRKAFDKFNLISGLHSFLSLTDKQFLNILPTCSLLSKQDEKTLIDKLKDLDFLGKDFKAA